MHLRNLSTLLAALAIAFGSFGCTKEEGDKSGDGQNGDAPAADQKTFDPNDRDQLFLVFAAHQSDDQEIINQVCVKYGLYTAANEPDMEKYKVYEGAMQAYIEKNPEEVGKFIQKHEGKWKEYVEDNNS